MDRTTFDQAGKSLIEEEDRLRMEQMGDFDTNPDVSTDAIHVWFHSKVTTLCASGWHRFYHVSHAHALCVFYFVMDLYVHLLLLQPIRNCG
jgi:hypothetical protein